MTKDKHERLWARHKRERLAKLVRDKRDWLLWFQKYGAVKFLESFLYNVEGAMSRCIYCREDIYVDILKGGGVPDWATRYGDYGCVKSPETCENGTGGHQPSSLIRG